VVPGAGYIPVCPRCNSARPTDMHEGLIKKGDVQGWPELDRYLINHQLNCVVICHRCHMEHGQTSEMTEWFIEHKINHGYTIEQITAWIDSLPFKVQTLRIGYVREYQQTSEQSMAK
jgi:hypothetical protein